MMIMAIFDYLWFIPVWFSSFLFHEMMHGFEHWHQTGQVFKIRIWWYTLFTIKIRSRTYKVMLPSMRVILSGESKDRGLMLLAGGLYTSIVLVCIAFFHTVIAGQIFNGLNFSLLCVGCIQFFYGFYEMLLLDWFDDRRDYMKFHYVLYIVVFILFSAVWVLLNGGVFN